MRPIDWKLEGRAPESARTAAMRRLRTAPLIGRGIWAVDMPPVGFFSAGDSAGNPIIGRWENPN